MIINASIQVIPLGKDKSISYPLVDEAIAMIEKSGFNYIIGAFETTIEGPYEGVQDLLRAIQDLCYTKDNLQFLIYSKLHICGGSDITFEDKNLNR